MTEIETNFPATTEDAPAPVGRPAPLSVRVRSGRDASLDEAEVDAFLSGLGPRALCQHPGWLDVFRSAFGHETHLIEARRGGRLAGLLPLADVRGPIFGRTLSSLPYVNYGGALAADDETSTALIDRALAFAAERGGARLLLRHDRAVEHPALAPHPGSRMNMRRPLPADVAALDASIGSSRRNQVRKARKLGMTVEWGAEGLLPEFYRIFSENMRDLGSPAYGVGLFREALRRFPGRAELAVVRLDGLAVAAGFLTHGPGVTEVPSASSLRAYNSTNANLLMYWHLLERAVLRGQASFDFGRSAPGDSVYLYKERWGAVPSPAGWQVAGAVAGGSGPDTQGEGRRLFARVWKRLPLPLANRLGPPIIRGLP